MQVRIKGVFTISLLEKLKKIVEPLKNGQVYKTVVLVAFFGFFRLASLLPNSAKEFQKTRYLTLGDVIWGKPGVHLVITCAKNMQTSGQYQVVQLPLLSNSILCPVQAIRSLIKTQNLLDKDGPLFQIMTKIGMIPLVAGNARSVIKVAVTGLGLNPKHFTIPFLWAQWCFTRLQCQRRFRKYKTAW